MYIRRIFLWIVFLAGFLQVFAQVAQAHLREVMQFSYKSFAWEGGGEKWVVAVAFIAKRPACLRIKTNQTRWGSFRSLQQIFDNFLSVSFECKHHHLDIYYLSACI